MSDRHERVAKAAAAAKQRVDAKLGDIWWAFLFRGLLAVALAICAVVWPQKTMRILIKLLGAYFLVDGLAGAIGAYRSNDRGAQIVPAIISLALGLVLLLWTGVSEKIFLVMAGIWLVIQGAGLFLSSRDMDRDSEERSLAGIVSGVMILIGLVFIFWTNTGVVAVSWLIGVGAFIVGALLIYLATRLKNLRSRLASLGHHDE
jgi:uncharacterized membrane protein HdeD (DUF308 family)